MSWTEHADMTLQAVLENMVAEGLLAKQVGLQATPSQIVGASRELLAEVIRSSLPLAHLMDTSDLVLHAEGPAVREAAVRLSAVNWLTQAAEKAMRSLSANLFDLADRDARNLMRSLDLRLTGFAPGSLYAGFSIVPPEADLISSDDEPVFARARAAIKALPSILPMIGDDRINPGIRDLLPDPAERDSTLSVLYDLSPTGHRGIHTLEMSSPGVKGGTLSQRERVVIHDAIRRPDLTNRKSGSFVGELREIDLDARRFHLRDVQGIGTLRCVIGSIDSMQAKALIGEFVRVAGEYETDRHGKPRFMIVHNAQLLPRAYQPSLGPADDA